MPNNRRSIGLGYDKGIWEYDWPLQLKLQLPVYYYLIIIFDLDPEFLLIPLLLFFYFQSHSIHGMTDDDKSARPHREMGILTFEEKKFLLAVERGDVASVRR